jgi:RimJ/RimL family protein N-acetyltransferase
MDPLLIDVPPEFDSARLVLRCPRPGDGATLHAAVCESLDDLRPWMPWAQETPTLDESEALCRRFQADYLARRDLVLHVYTKDGGRFVGGTGLHRIDWDVRRFEIGYWVRRGEGGRGYVTEWVERLARLAFEQLLARRVEIRCDARNQRSVRVAERAGFTLDGVLRQDSLTPAGESRDTRVHSIVSADLSRSASPGRNDSPHR